MEISKIQKTMSSVEIAELTGKEHRNVLADIRKMMIELELHAAEFSATQTYGNNNTKEIFNLPKRETLVLVSGYSIELRAKIIDRWEELERKNSVPKSLEEQTLEVMQGLVQRIEMMKPKAEFFDRIVDARGARTVLESAKLLKIDKPKSFYQILRRDGILAMGNLPYQKFVNQGYFRVNLTEKNGFTFSTTYVTNKGLAWLQEKYGSRA